MDGTFVEKLEEIILQSKAGEVYQVPDEEGVIHTFLNAGKQLVPIKPIEKTPEMLHLGDLESLAKVVISEIELGKWLDVDRLFVKVEDDMTVSVVTSLDKNKARDVVYTAEYKSPRIRIGDWLDYEQFVIMLRANFLDTPDRDKILQMISKIVQSNETELEDNGVSQVVKTSRGTQVNANEIKSVMSLQPCRIFPECTQPMTDFIFRIRDNGNSFALFDADNGSWKMFAKGSIKAHLKKLFEDQPKVIVLA